MLQPTIITWILIVFGIVFIFLPMVYVQFLVVLRPHHRKAKDIVIGKGQDYRYKTHFRMTYGIAWADLIIWLPLLFAGSAGVISGQAWGYALWAASGGISVYISLAMVRQIEIETRVPGGSGEAGHQKQYLGEVPCLFDTPTSLRYYGDGTAAVEGIPDYTKLSKSKRRELVNK